MIEIPKPFRAMSLTISLADHAGNGDNWLELAFVDEGAGYFVEMKSVSMDDRTAFRMDADELVRIAAWAAEICKALDAKP